MSIGFEVSVYGSSQCAHNCWVEGVDGAGTMWLCLRDTGHGGKHVFGWQWWMKPVLWWERRNARNRS